MTIPNIKSNYTQGFGAAPDDIAVPAFSQVAPASSNVSYPLGKRWVNTLTNTEYVLTSFSSAGGTLSATWTLLGTNSGALNTLTGDSGGAISPSAANITLAGTAGQIITTGAGSTITWTLSSTLLAPGTLEVTGLLTGDAGITISGGAVAINSGTNAFGLSTDASNTTVSIATGAAAKLVTLGSTNGASSLALQCGTGNMTIQGAAASTITIGKSDQTGTIRIANSTGAMAGVDLMNGVAAGAQVLNIASGTNITAAQTVNLLNNATPGATTTLNIMGGVASAGNQVVAALGGAISQGTNSASLFGGIATGGTNTFNVFAGAFTGGTNSINLFSGAFTTVAATFNLFSGASTSVGTANIGTGTSAAHVTNIGSNAGGNVTIIGGATATIGIGLGGNAAQIITIGAAAQTGTISVGTSTATNAVNIATGNGNKTLSLATGTGTNAIHIADGAGTNTLTMANGASVNIVTVGSTNSTSATTIQAGTGGLALSAAGAVSVVPALNSAAGVALTVNGRVFQATFTGQTTASGASQVFTITNSAVSGTTQAIILSADNLGANDAQMTITRVLQSASTIAVTLKNNGAAALNGDVHITGWVLN